MGYEVCSESLETTLQQYMIFPVTLIYLFHGMVIFVFHLLPQNIVPMRLSRFDRQTSSYRAALFLFCGKSPLEW